MSKKTKIIISSILALVLVGIIAFLFLYKDKNGVDGLSIVKNAFPFGRGSEVDNDTPINIDTGEPINEPAHGKSLPRFFQIHKTPIAGAVSFSRKDRGATTTPKTIVRYLESGVGHIFETDMDTLTETRISNTTRLKIHEAFFGNNGKSVVIRYLDDKDEQTIRSFLIKLSDITRAEAVPSEELLIQKDDEIEGLFLPKNISSLAISDDTKKIFYIVDNGDSSTGTIYDILSGKSSVIFSSEFTEWLTQWPNKNTIELTTKPSGGVAGVSYSLNTNTKELTREVGGINGLTTLTSPNGENILYSESIKNGFTLNIYNKKDGTFRKLPLATLPEKCVWSKLNEDIVYCAVPTSIQKGLYPDDWYQGSVSFNDELWLIDIVSDETTLMASPQTSLREEVDMTTPFVDNTEQTFFFTNKKDGSLWGVRLYIF